MDDFTKGENVLEASRPLRRKLFLYARIDTLFSRADLGKHVGDVEFAKNDFVEVISLCNEFPEKNESTMTSAVFSLGKICLDLKQVDAAREHFLNAQGLLKKSLFELL